MPGLIARVPHEAGGYLVKVNQCGFRCEHEVTQKKPGGMFRILLFGDSFTAGDGVSNKHRYGDLLEKRFERLQILNFGLSGSGTDQQYLVFQEYAKDLEYDLLLISPLVENIRRVISHYRVATSRENDQTGYLAKPYYELSGDELSLHHVPVPKGILDEKDLPSEEKQYVDQGGRHAALRKVVNTALKPLKPIIQSALSYQPVPYYDRPDDPAWLLMKAILKRWIDESGQHPVLICPIPLYQHIEQTAPADSYRERFQELSEFERVGICDPLPRFWMETPENRRRCRFKNDPHFTPFGHEVLADALAPVIEKYLRKENH